MSENTDREIREMSFQDKKRCNKSERGDDASNDASNDTGNDTGHDTGNETGSELGSDNCSDVGNNKKNTHNDTCNDTFNDVFNDACKDICKDICKEDCKDNHKEDHKDNHKEDQNIDKKEDECGKPQRKSCGIHPECPLKLLKYIEFSSDGSASQVLALCGEIQIVTFKQLQYMVGKSLSFVIPKCICDEDEQCGQCFTLTLDPNVIIDDVNGVQILVSIIETPDKYYIVIPIVDGTISGCGDLVLYFINLKILLTPVASCNPSSCVDAWRWLPSIISG
jgi:hypothetical protein